MNHGRITVLIALMCLLGVGAASAKELTYRDICDDPVAYYKKSVTFRTTYLGTLPKVLWHVEAVVSVSKYYHFRQTGIASVPLVLKRSDSAAKTMKNLKDGMSITVAGTVGKKVFKSRAIYYIKISKIKAEKAEVEGVARDKLDTGKYEEVDMKDVEDDPLSYENKRIRFTCPYAGTARPTGTAGGGIGKEGEYVRLTTRRRGESAVPVLIPKSNKEASEAVKDGAIKKGLSVEVFGRVRVAAVWEKKIPHVIVECINQADGEDNKSEEKDEKASSKIEDEKERRRRLWKARQRLRR